MKHLILLLIFLMVPVLHAQQIASDNFARPDGLLGSNWTLGLNTLSVYNNQVQSNTAGTSQTIAYWNANSFANDQFSKLVLSAAEINSTASGVGVCVRCSSTSGGNGYVFYGLSVGYFQWGKVVDGTFTLFNQTGRVANVGDVIELDAVGTTITGLVNGTQIFSVTDSDLSSGNAGISGYGQGTDVMANNWAAGDLPVMATNQEVTLLGSATAGYPFSIKVLLVDVHGNIATAASNTSVALSVTAGSGSLFGTTTGMVTEGELLDDHHRRDLFSSARWCRADFHADLRG